MLYDNALLALAYLEGYQAAGTSRWAQVAQEIFSYVLRDMTSPEGGFYSAEDADTEARRASFMFGRRMISAACWERRRAGWPAGITA